jgi:hypothetical protein
LDYVTRNNWDSRRLAYLGLVDLLVSGQHNSAVIPPDPFDQRDATRREPRKEPSSELALK